MYLCFLQLPNLNNCVIGLVFFQYIVYGVVEVVCLFTRVRCRWCIIILERSSFGICLLCAGPVLILWSSLWLLCYVVFPFPVYEEAMQCLVVRGLPHRGTVFLSVPLPVRARIHLLIIFLNCMLQSSVAPSLGW